MTRQPVPFRVPVWYFAHPVGNARLTSATVAENIARAKRWLRWLIDREPAVAFAAPWIPHVECIGSDGTAAQRARGLRDDISVANLCDGIVLCGGEITAGMIHELEVCDVVCDLTCLGLEPPSPERWGDNDPDLVGPIAFGRERWAIRVEEDVRRMFAEGPAR